MQLSLFLYTTFARYPTRTVLEWSLVDELNGTDTDTASPFMPRVFFHGGHGDGPLDRGYDMVEDNGVVAG